jgi:hypothetical protein
MCSTLSVRYSVRHHEVGLQTFVYKSIAFQCYLDYFHIHMVMTCWSQNFLLWSIWFQSEWPVPLVSYLLMYALNFCEMYIVDEEIICDISVGWLPHEWITLIAWKKNQVTSKYKSYWYFRVYHNPGMQERRDGGSKEGNRRKTKADKKKVKV